MNDENRGECGTAKAGHYAAPCVIVGCNRPRGHHDAHEVASWVDVAATLTPPSPTALAEPAAAALWAAVSLQAEQIRGLLALESFHRQRDEAREQRNAAVALRVADGEAREKAERERDDARSSLEAARRWGLELEQGLRDERRRTLTLTEERDDARREASLLGLKKEQARAAELERERDAARAEVERLRLGRAELEQMRRAALAELEAEQARARRLASELEEARRLLGRMTPDPRETGLLEERRELLSRPAAARCANCRHRWNGHETGGGRCAATPFGGCGCERFVDA